MRGRPETTRAKIIAAVAADTSPIGMSHGQIAAATGLTGGSLSSVLGKAHMTGRVFTVGTGRDMRYFATAERREACREAAEADLARLKDERRAIYDQRQQAYQIAYRSTPEYRKRRSDRMRAQRAAARPPKPPKPEKPAKVEQVVKAMVRQPAPKPKHKQKPMKVRGPVPTLVQRGPRQVKPKVDLPVIVPEGLRIQVCPSGKDQRFTFDPPPGWRGAITHDWLERRLQEAKR